MRLNPNEVLACLDEYKGPQYEIEKHMKVFQSSATYSMASIDTCFLLFAPFLYMQSAVGILPEYPHPVASSISSRMMVELGMLTAVMAAAAAVIGGFIASAAFAVTSFVFATTVYVVWPITKPFLKLFLGLASGILERISDYVLDIFSDGGLFYKLKEFYTFGGISASLEMLKPITFVLLTMVVLIRFTLSRRPKNFRKWVNVVSCLTFCLLYPIGLSGLQVFYVISGVLHILCFAGFVARN